MTMPKIDIRTTIMILSFLGFGSIGSIFTFAFKAYDWHNQVNETIESHERTMDRIERLEKEKEHLIKVFDKRLDRDSLRMEKVMHWMKHYNDKYNDGLYDYVTTEKIH